MNRLEKELIRRRDGEVCRVCGRQSRGVYEGLLKTGTVSASTSAVLCGLCREYMHGHAIKPHGESCNGPMGFEMSGDVAQQIFRGMAVPPHVTVVQVMTEEVYPPED